MVPADEHDADGQDAEIGKATGNGTRGRNPVLLTEPAQIREHQRKGDEATKPETGCDQMQEVRGKMDVSFKPQTFFAVPRKGQ